MSSPWMPLYVADYLAGTTHLSAAEHGAYMLLIMHYWQKGSLPADEAILARICRMTVREWAKSRDVLASFFGDGWTHERIDSELEKARVKSEARAEYGSRGGKAKALKNNDATAAKASCLPDENVAKALASSSQPTLTPSLHSGVAPKRQPRTAIRKSAIEAGAQPNERNRAYSESLGMSAEAFRSEWQGFRSHHRAKGSVMADWDAAWETWARNWTKFTPRAGPQLRPTGRETLTQIALGNFFDEPQSSEPVSPQFAPDRAVASDRHFDIDLSQQDPTDAGGTILDFGQRSAVWR